MAPENRDLTGHYHWALSKKFQETVEKRGLFGMDSSAGFVEGQEFGVVDFPRGAAGGGVGRGLAGKAMHAFAALGVVDRRQGDEIACGYARLFERLAAGGRFERFARVGQTLGNAPRGLAVVVARGMDQKHLKDIAAPAIKKCACRFLHGRPPLSAFVEDAGKLCEEPIDLLARGFVESPGDRPADDGV